MTYQLASSSISVSLVSRKVQMKGTLNMSSNVSSYTVNIRWSSPKVTLKEIWNWH